MFYMNITFTNNLNIHETKKYFKQDIYFKME